jgi:dolichol-phosphate mannosyltransferase
VAKKNEILLVIPTYNESESIIHTIRDIFKKNKNIDILIIDDNSPDGTSDIIRFESKKNSNLYLIVGEKKDGIALAYKKGFYYAIKNKYKYVAQCDGDGSHSAEDLCNMIELIKQKDNTIVIGSRYISKNNKVWRLDRFLISRLGNYYINYMMGLSMKDTTSGFRIYPCSILKNINFSSFKGKSFVFQVEMSREIVKNNLNFIEYDINFKDRVFGESKLDLNTIYETLLYVSKTRKN